MLIHLNDVADMVRDCTPHKDKSACDEKVTQPCTNLILRSERLLWKTSEFELWPRIYSSITILLVCITIRASASLCVVAEWLGPCSSTVYAHLQTT